MALVLAKCFIFLSFLFILSCSGTLVGFSYDARRNTTPLSAIETISFLKRSNLSRSQIRLFVADNSVLDSFSKTGISVDLYVNKDDVSNLWKSKPYVISWLKTHFIAFLPRINITSIIVSYNQSAPRNQLCFLLPALNSIQSALKSFDFNYQVKVSTTVSLSMLMHPDGNHNKCLDKVIEFIRKFTSFMVVETVIGGELSLGDQFIRSVTTKAITATTLIPDNNIPMVLNVKSSTIPSAVEIAEFSKKMIRSIENQNKIVDRIGGIFVEISPMEEFKQKEQSMEEEQIFPTSHRELLNGNKSSQKIKTTEHELVMPPPTALPTGPVTNPATTPFSVPSTNPTPLIITVPSTPSTLLPTSPGTTPVTNPSNVPISAPVTIPSTNPVVPPTTVTMTNPVATPIMVPMAPPITNPVTTYPITTPFATPLTVLAPPPPITTSPIVSGRSWCVAKTDAPETALQAGIDYACGIGGADCSAIQQTGSCYNPSALRDHASFAFNSYYQKNPVPSSCDFGGIAIMVNINPSSGTCIYPSSSYNSSSSSSVLNTNYPTSSTAVYGSGPPAFAGDSASDTVSLVLLLTFTSITVSFIMGKHLIDL